MTDLATKIVQVHVFGDAQEQGGSVGPLWYARDGLVCCEGTCNDPTKWMDWSWWNDLPFQLPKEWQETWKRLIEYDTRDSYDETGRRFYEIMWQILFIENKNELPDVSPPDNYREFEND